MFDYLICQYPLPVPEESILLQLNWSKEVFQTKDLENLLFTYLISKDGFLYRDSNPEKYGGFALEFHEDNWGLDYPGEERANGLENALALMDYKIDYNGRIVFYTIVKARVRTHDENCMVKFVANFTDGKLENIDFIEQSCL